MHGAKVTGSLAEVSESAIYMVEEPGTTKRRVVAYGALLKICTKSHPNLIMLVVVKVWISSMEDQ